MISHDFADGKYTVINDNGTLTALRNGEPWQRDLVGDNLVYWMLVEVDRLKAELAALQDSRQLKPRCELCQYQQGHSIGCKNNPIDAELREKRRREAFDSLPDDYEVN